MGPPNNKAMVQGAKTYDIDFRKKPPPSPEGGTNKNWEKRKVNGIGENGATLTYSQNRGHRPHLSDSATCSPRALSKSKVKTSISKEVPNMKECGPHSLSRDERRSEHPSKRRKGTPHKPPSFAQANNINGSSKESPSNKRRDDVSSTVKSLFGCPPPSSQTNSCGQIGSAESDDDEKHSPWQAVWSMDLNDQTRYYWCFCYGSDTLRDNQLQTNHGNWSAKRKRPVKGCLNSTSSRIETPKSCTDCPAQGQSDDTCLKTTRKVRFGPTRAAEYESTEPSQALTPISADVAERRYPTVAAIPTIQEEIFLQETKENTATLEEWDQDDEESDDFFTLSQPFDDSSEDGSPTNIKEIGGVLLKQKRRSSIFVRRPSQSTICSNIDSSDDEEHFTHSIDTSPQSIVDNPPLPPVCDTTIANLHGLSLDSPKISSDGVNNPARTSGAAGRLVVASPHSSEYTSILCSNEEWSQFHFEPEKRTRKQLSGKPHLLWLALLEIGRALKSNQTDLPSWLHQICCSSAFLSFIQAALLEIELALSRSIQSEYVEPRLMKTLSTQMNSFVARVAHECSILRSFLSQALCHLPFQLKSKLQKIRQIELEKDIRILKAKIRMAKKRATLMRQNYKTRAQLWSAQSELLKHDCLWAIFAPVNHQFVSHETFEIRFDPEMCNIHEYAPGYELRITGNIRSSKTNSIELVSCSDSNTSEFDNQPQTKFIRDLLEREISSLCQGEDDCQETVLRWILFLGCLERHYFSKPENNY